MLQLVFFLTFVLCWSTVAVVQSPSHVQLSEIPWTAAHHAPLSFTISWSLHRFMSIHELVMLSNHPILCCPLLLLPSIFPSITVFSSKSALHIMWPKYWSFSVSISPSNEYSGLISFRFDWFDLLEVQGTLRSLVIFMDIQWRDSAIHMHVSILPQTPLPSRLPHNTKQSPLCCAAWPCWWSVLNIAALLLLLLLLFLT